jgi:hypothetical protein
MNLNFNMRARCRIALSIEVKERITARFQTPKITTRLPEQGGGKRAKIIRISPANRRMQTRKLNC